MGQWHSGWRCGRYLRYAQGIQAMRGEGKGGTHGGTKRVRRHISGQPWSKSFRETGGRNRTRGTHSRVWKKTEVSDEWDFGDSGMNTGNAQVDGETRASVGMDEITGLLLGVVGENDGGRSEDGVK